MTNPKSNLNEYCQIARLPLPIYRLEVKDGLDHAPTFQVRCEVGAETALGEVQPNRKLAEKSAASMLLQKFITAQKETKTKTTKQQERPIISISSLKSTAHGSVSLSCLQYFLVDFDNYTGEIPSSNYRLFVTDTRFVPDTISKDTIQICKSVPIALIAYCVKLISTVEQTNGFIYILGENPIYAKAALELGPQIKVIVR